MSAIAKSRSGRYVAAQLLADSDSARLIAVIGLNPQSDVEEILIAGLGEQTAGDSRCVIIARGNFDPVRLAAEFQQKGAVAAKYHGATVFVQNDANLSTALAFPHPRIVVVGDLEAVQAVVSQTATAADIDSGLSEQANLMARENDIWFATLLSGRFLTQQLGVAIPQIQNLEALRMIARSSGGAA